MLFTKKSRCRWLMKNKWLIIIGLKDEVFFNLRSNAVYNFWCGRCNATYYGETYWHLKVRVGDHSGFSTLTRKMLKSKTTTAVKDHMFFCDHMFSLEAFKIWQIIQNFFLRSKKVLKSHDKPELNRNEKSLLLYLFD